MQRFKCKFGFSFYYRGGINCNFPLGGKMWIFADPCEPKNPCLNGGTCKPNAEGDYTCTCSEGYEGPTCDQRIGMHYF